MLNLFDPSSSNEVADLCDRYLADLNARAALGSVSPDSVREVSRLVRSFVAQAPTTVAELRNSHLTAWLTARPEWRSPHTYSHAVGAVVACFRWLAEESLIGRVPFSRRTLRLPTPQPRQPIQESEYRTMMRLARRRDSGYAKSRAALRAALHFLWTTGARTCEMREIEWDHVDVERGLAVLPEHKTDRTGVPRIILLPASVVRLFRLWRRRGRTSGRIFRNGRGRPWTREGFAALFRRYADLAGVRSCVTAYCLRHGFCCRGLRAGLGDRQIADLMGHSSTRYVSWYGRGVRMDSDYLRAALELLNGGQ